MKLHFVYRYNNRESNCFMVPSKGEEHLKEMHRHVRKPIIQTESADNTTETLSAGAAAADRAEEAAAVVAAAAAADQTNTTETSDTITNDTP